ncbi:DUF1674 domain-containing protein [Rhizobium sp. CSW-27]|uniref:DUF1674 domain-containing protein n=1 Tax=Rhizobium sp. CSW-27 TaxID=2839985 RepID=UPI001C00FB7F|nr:DUF1674 domain-containing protein [Rhizobium sp. CSW-27]MBT9372711.1 DUF1674 domain-containing protein [Rhizobium sp. CSW-27]
MQTPDNDNRETEALAEAAPKVLSPAAQRALQEAEERRAREKPLDLPPELGGRGGADPARFGDWEINGRAIDF